jgi:short-subunit dehydrogenase
MGIGKELAKIFAADGHDLVLVARSEDKLRSLGGELESAHGITAHVVPADLTDPAAPANIFSELEHKGLQLDYLVNNAGFGTTGPFAAGSLGPQMDMIQVNVDALVALTHLALQGMLARKKGRVLNIADTAGNAKSILFKLGAAPADKVARHAYRSMMKGKVVAIEGLMNWLSAFSVRFGPRAFVRKVTRWLNQTS